MSMFPDTVTIINVVNHSGIKTYNRHVVSGVLFENNKASIQREYGVDYTGSKTCYIPIKSLSDLYVSEAEYKLLSDDVKSEYITLQKGDYIVVGIATDTDINDLYKLFNDVMRINSIDYFLRGTLKHFEVSGS